MLDFIPWIVSISQLIKFNNIACNLLLNNGKIKKDEKEKTEDKQTINKENKPEEINNNPKQNEKKNKQCM